MPAANRPLSNGADDLPSSGSSQRVLHLNSMLTGGGTDDQCLKLAMGLRQLGQQVWIAGPEGREYSDLIRRLGMPFLPTPPEGPLKLRFITACAAHIRRERIQIVQGHHGRDIWPTILAAKLSGTRPKVVLTRHLAKSPSSWFSRRFVLGQCAALIAVSDFVAKVLREGVYEPDSPEPERRSRPPLLGDHAKIHVVHGGIDTEAFQPRPAEKLRAEWKLEAGHFAFAVAGGYSLPRGKGQREFLAAAAQIHEKIPQARFLIIGRGNMADILRADIARLGLAGKAWLTSYCEAMPKAMNAIDCLVHPQIGTEAFGLVLCEAFACGRPVIASALDGIPEAFAFARLGRLVTPESIDELAGAMVELAGKPALSLEQRQALHEKIAAQASVPVMAEQVLRLYRRLLAA